MPLRLVRPKNPICSIVFVRLRAALAQLPNSFSRSPPLLVSLPSPLPLLSPLLMLCLLYVYVCRPLLRLQNIRWLVFVFAWLNLFDVAIRRILIKQKTHQKADSAWLTGLYSYCRCVWCVTIDMHLTSSLSALSLISFVCALRGRGGQQQQCRREQHAQSKFSPCPVAWQSLCVRERDSSRSD